MHWSNTIAASSPATRSTVARPSPLKRTWPSLLSWAPASDSYSPGWKHTLVSVAAGNACSASTHPAPGDRMSVEQPPSVVAAKRSIAACTVAVPASVGEAAGSYDTPAAVSSVAAYRNAGAIG